MPSRWKYTAARSIGSPLHRGSTAKRISPEVYPSATWMACMILACCSSVNCCISELYFRRLVGTSLGSEVTFLLEAEKTGGNVIGEPPYRLVILLGRFVECTPLGADAVFGTFQLRLQFQEILVGLQFRITFHGNQ